MGIKYTLKSRPEPRVLLGEVGKYFYLASVSRFGVRLRKFLDRPTLSFDKIHLWCLCRVRTATADGGPRNGLRGPYPLDIRHGALPRSPWIGTTTTGMHRYTVVYGAEHPYKFPVSFHPTIGCPMVVICVSFDHSLVWTRKDTFGEYNIDNFDSGSLPFFDQVQ